MADGLTTQSATPATVPASSLIATLDLGTRGHAQVVLVGGAKTVTNTSVAASASSTQLLAANTARVGCFLYNDSTSPVRIKLGTTASSTDFNLYMAAGGFWVVDFHYNGRIDAIWDTATGNMRIGEAT